MKFADKPVSKGFVAAYEDALDGKPSKTEALILAGLKLASTGYGSLSRIEKELVSGIPSLKTALDAAKKADTARAKKRAEKAAQAAAETGDADEEDETPASESGDAPATLAAASEEPEGDE